MRVSRRTVLGLIGAATAAGPVRAADPPAYDLRPRDIGAGLWLVEGARDCLSAKNGGAVVNAVLIETEAGITVIDTGPSLIYGAALRRVTEGLGGKGVEGVILTHHHADHALGCGAFAGLPIRALAQSRVLAGQLGRGYVTELTATLGDWMAGTEPVPPDRDLAPGRLEIGGRFFEVLPLSGHTAADLALFDVATGTLITGDLAVLGRAPTTQSANLRTWIASIAELSGIKAAAVIPGHGPYDPEGESLSQTRNYLGWLAGTLHAAAEEGRDMLDILDTPLPPEWAALGAQPDSFLRSVTDLYPGFETRATAPAG